MNRWACRRCGREYRFKAASRRCEDGCAAVDSAHLGLVAISTALALVMLAETAMNKGRFEDGYLMEMPEPMPWFDEVELLAELGATICRHCRCPYGGDHRCDVRPA